MRQLNAAIKDALEQRDYGTYYERNIDFHNTFLSLSDNEPLLRIVMTMKRRLYDFPGEAISPNGNRAIARIMPI